MQDTKKFVRREYRFSSIAALVLFTGLFLTAGAWGQGSPVPAVPQVVYVSASGGLILSVDPTTGAISTLIPASGAAYEGLVVGPDNVDAGRSYLLYACDPTNNTIIRFDPNDLTAKVETVYAGGGSLQQPQCGRFTNTGDLIVGSKVAGSGLWKIANAAYMPLNGGGFSAPTQLAPVGNPASQVSEGVAQKNIGDLLVVDTANKEVIRSQYPAFNVPAVFISPSALLPGPFGIARKSNGEIYVSNQSKKANNIVHYNAQGMSGSTCLAFNNKTAPAFMQMSADDTLYVATASSTSGAVYSVKTATCVATQVPTGNSLPPLIGIALPPTSVTQTQSFSGTQTFNFGYAAYQFTSGGPCTLSVTATPVSPGVIQGEINNPLNTSMDLGDPFYGGSPAVNLGWDGFELVFDVPPPAGSCTPLYSDGTYSDLLSAHVDNELVSNPRVLRCGTPDEPPDGVCQTITMFNDYPLGGMLPDDGSYGGKTTKCRQFIINGALGSPEPAQFCNFQPPLSNVAPPGIAGVFSSGQNLSVKFKLASASGSCANGPYVDDANVLMSVAQIADKKGNPVFNPISLNASGNSTPIQPIFKTGNQQYQFSLSLQGYAPGIYSLTATFLSANTMQQTVLIKVQ